MTLLRPTFFAGTTRAIAMLILALLLAGCAAGRLNSEGKEQLSAGKYEAAMSKFEEAVKLEPDNPEYRVSLRMGREQAVRQLLLDAERAMSAGKLDEAQTAYRRLLAVDPANPRAQAGLEQIARARRHAPLLEQAQKLFKQKNYNGALANVRLILAENPANAEASSLLYQIEEVQVRNAHAPIRLKSRYVKPVTLQFRDSGLRMVFEALSKITGINFLFDGAVKDTQRVTIFVNDVSVEDAIDLILAQSQLAEKVLNDNTILVYPSTPAKHKEYQEQVVRSFYLTNIDPKKAQAMLKTVLDAGTTFIDDKANLLIIRDTPEVVRMAEKLLATADVTEPEVMLEVEVLEVKRSTLQQLGVDYPGRVSFSAANAAGGTDKLTIDDVKNLNSSTILVSPLSVGIDITKQDSDANILASPRIRARNREKARVHIGDRVPVITNAVTPTTSQPVVTGSIQYLDVGLKLEIEPTIHLDSDVGIKLSLEVSSIVKEIQQPVAAGGSIAYQIGTRNAATVLRLKDGETQVLAGLISDEERTNIKKIPGLGDIPAVGMLFGTHKDDNIKTEIVLSITPRIVRNVVRPNASNTEFWFGSETRKLGRPLTVQSVGRGESLIPRPAPATDAAPAPGVTQAPGAPVATSTTATAVAAGVAGSAGERADREGSTEAVPLVLEGPEKVAVGKTFQVALVVKAAQPVNGMKAQLSFDPEVFEVVAVVGGSLTRKGSAPAQFVHKVDRGAGHVDAQIFPVAGPGFTGTADAMIVTFKAIAPKAQSPINLTSAELKGTGGAALTSTMPSPLRLAATAVDGKP